MRKGVVGVMAAYFIVDVDVRNTQAYEAYKQPAAASLSCPYQKLRTD
jgi:hypothetical protein